jgi:protein-tyrosine phosphatase
LRSSPPARTPDDGGIGDDDDDDMRILMVCLGNICRSPTAAAALRAAAATHGVVVDVDSAGTAAWHEGKGADPRTVEHARRRGLDLAGHRARRVRDEDFTMFDRIYAMDRANLRALQQRGPAAAQGKLALFLGDDEVPDPWAGGPDDFERVLDLCLAASVTIAATLARR